MKIVFKNRFIKQYQHLKEGEKKRIDRALLLFEQNPYDPRLRNHPLQKSGKIKDIGLRAIAAGGDLRLVFQEHEKYTLVLFLAVGSHNQVY